MKNNRVIENILSLTTIKGLEYILAFVMFPYLVRVLQVEKYGLIVFSQSIVNYFTLLTDYGFNLLAPKEIAQHDSIEQRSRIFTDIFAAKIVLLILWSAIFFIGLLLMEYFNETDFKLYLVVYITVIGNVLFPVWFFQGIQRMRYITIVNIIARAFSVISIFMFVHEPDDYLLAAFCQSITPIVATICSWIVIVRNYPEVVCYPTMYGIKKVIKDAWPIFVSNIAINLYTASNIVFLGIITNNTVVGYFSGAKKIIDNITQLFSPISQAIYPYVSNKVTESRDSAIIFLTRVVKLLGGAAFVLTIFVLIFAPWIVEVLLGSGYEQSVLFLRIMAFLPFLIALSNVYGIQTMLSFGMQKEFSRVLISASIFNTCLVIPMIYLFGGLGVCIVISLTECFVTFAMWKVLKYNGIVLWRE